MAYALCIAIALGASQTGLTLKAQLVDTSGANVGGEVTTGFTEIGVGNYLWHYVSFPDDHRGGVKFSTTGGTLKAFHAINPEEAEYSDAKTSSRLASGSYTAPDNTTIASIYGVVDTEVAAIKAKTDNLPASPAATGDAMTLTAAYDAAKTAAQAGDAMTLTAAYDAAKTAAQAGDAMTLTSGERDAIAAALLDLADAIETGLTTRQALRLALAALAGTLSGAATDTITIKNAVADNKDRLVAAVDADGNRTAILVDVS